MMHPNITEGADMDRAFATPRLDTGITLRQWLLADTLTCIAFGTLLVAGSAPLATPLALPPSLLFYAGVILFPCAALMALAAKTLAKPLSWLVVAGNLAWIGASIAVAWMFDLTGIGLAFLTAQAAAVGIIATGEWRALNAST